MKLGIVVNVMGTTDVGQSNYRLAAAATAAGHEVSVMSTGNFAYDADDTVRALARSVPAGKRFQSAEAYVDALMGDEKTKSWISVDALDALLLRNNPAVQNPWARGAAIEFARLAMRNGVVVLNHPNGLAKAMNKLYLQTFPQDVRPRTLICRDQARIEAFVRDVGDTILKPLQGSGGRGVFQVSPDNLSNFATIASSVARDGYVVAQEKLPAAAAGDTRLFLMNGEPLQVEGKYAAFKRVRQGDDLRANVHAGAKIREAVIDDTILALAEKVKPRLIEDGMFLVGLDIVGDKLLEINVFAPGGLGGAGKLGKVNFLSAVIDAIERKVAHKKLPNNQLSNLELATF